MSFQKIGIELFRINSTSYALGKSIENLKFRRNTGTTIVAIERDNKMKISPDPKLILKTGMWCLSQGQERTSIRPLYSLRKESLQACILFDLFYQLRGRDTINKPYCMDFFLQYHFRQCPLFSSQRLLQAHQAGHL